MGKKTLEETYQKKTQHEHILARPDMYIGTTERVTEDMWWVDDETNPAEPVMKLDKLTWVPGLYKIFDEILVNAADNRVRDRTQTQIHVNIDVKEGKVRVWNNGEGIPVQLHKEHNLMIPEMIFGYLLTSSNYDDSEAKVTGGRNGFGAKLTNVFSRRFEVETCHTRSNKKFHMVWQSNMTHAEPPLVVNCDKGDTDYTQVTFWPDFAKFAMAGFDGYEGEHIVRLMKRRVYDIAACTGLKVKLNGSKVPVESFQQYVDLFPTFGEKKVGASYSRVNERWEICIRMSNIGFQQMSFVNSIATTRGGTHVNYITNQVIDKVLADIDKKKKDKDKKASRASGVKPFMIKPHLWIFINCQIENPSFDSQTKETLNTAKPRFGSDCPLPPSLLDYIAKSGIVQRAVDTANSKLMREMQGKVKATSSFINVPKLDDAAWAGQKGKSHLCTLILTEGDSAKSLAVAGIGAFPPEERQKWGVFPLRGKPLNVRDASMKKVLDCDEIQNLMKILGLKVGHHYTSAVELRYGHVMIMTDQDHDGSHIKGLVVNFFHNFWPSLLDVPGFLQQFITPIVKALPATKRVTDFEAVNYDVETKVFFSLPQFLEWREGMPAAQLKKYRIKYFKGLGTSSSEEGRSYFGNIGRHRILFQRSGGPCDSAIIKAFAKDKVDERKTWITNFSGASHQQIDYTRRDVAYHEFVDRELILFSVADCERSIPSLVDGFKPGQRKILYSCFKRNLNNEIKVAQLAGYVSEHSAYHHGEASLQATIVAMAQDFVGSNNLPLLKKSGQFGTRLLGGKDSAAARYIFTSLHPLTRAIFHKDDDAILDYKDDDGFPVEPRFYVPVIPMALVNGTSGIGTGFSTMIPNFSPLDIIANLRRLLNGEEVHPMVPWYLGFKGEITERSKGKFVSSGKYEIRHDGVIHITELPIGTWTTPYGNKLKEMKEKELICELKELNSEMFVDVGIFLHPEVHQAWTSEGLLEDKLGLRDYLHATNIMFFNEDETLTKYPDAESVLKEFYLIRLKYYQKRKDHLIATMEREVSIAQNKMRFVKEVTEGSLVVMRKKRRVLLEELRARKYTAFPPTGKADRRGVGAAGSNVGADSVEDVAGSGGAGVGGGDEFADDMADEAEAQALSGFRYLLDMPIYTLTDEMIAKLQRRLEQLLRDLQRQREMTTKQMWLVDLDMLEDKLRKFYAHRDTELEKVLRKASTQRRTHMEAPRRISQMSDKARSAFMKELEKKLPKAAKTSKAKEGGKEPGEKKSKQKGKQKKPKKRRDSDDDDDDEWLSSTDSSDDDESAGNDLAVSAADRWKNKKKVEVADAVKPKAKRTTGAKGAPAAKAGRKEGESRAGVVDADDFDLGGFGLDAIMSGTAPPPKSVAVPVQPPAVPRAAVCVDDDDDEAEELLFGSTTTTAARGVSSRKAPVPKAPAKTAARTPKPKRAPAKRKRKDSDSDESDSSESSVASSDGDSTSSSESSSASNSSSSDDDDWE